MAASVEQRLNKIKMKSRCDSLQLLLAPRQRQPVAETWQPHSN